MRLRYEPARTVRPREALVQPTRGCNARACVYGEAARGVVQVKDLVLGAKIAAEASLDEWKAQPAQTEVPRADLVAEVKRILG